MNKPLHSALHSFEAIKTRVGIIGIYLASKVYANNGDICVDFPDDSPRCYSKASTNIRINEMIPAEIKENKLRCWTKNEPYTNIKTGFRMDISAFCLTPEQVTIMQNLASK